MAFYVNRLPGISLRTAAVNVDGYFHLIRSGKSRIIIEVVTFLFSKEYLLKHLCWLAVRIM